MEKVSISPSNQYCPQAMFLYGTYKEDGSPNFGLFCWFSYCWDSEMGVMACIGGNKLTKDRIRADKVFSANLVSEPLLPLADYLGITHGYDAGKMDIALEVGRGEVLSVPVLRDSPWVYELEVVQELPLNDEGDIFICKVRNTLAAKVLLDESKSVDERLKIAAPVVCFGAGNGIYSAVAPAVLGRWGELKKSI